MIKLTEYTTRLNEIRAQAATEFKPLLQEHFADIFQKYPEVKSIGFKAFVPRFNDGDQCEFGIYGDEWRCEVNGENYREYNTDHPTNKNRAVNEFFKRLHEIDLDLIEDSLGSHIRVIISADSVEVEEYTDHE